MRVLQLLTFKDLIINCQNSIKTKKTIIGVGMIKKREVRKFKNM